MGPTASGRHLWSVCVFLIILDLSVISCCVRTGRFMSYLIVVWFLLWFCSVSPPVSPLRHSLTLFGCFSSCCLLFRDFLWSFNVLTNLCVSCFTQRLGPKGNQTSPPSGAGIIRPVQWYFHTFSSCLHHTVTAMLLKPTCLICSDTSCSSGVSFNHEQREDQGKHHLSLFHAFQHTGGSVYDYITVHRFHTSFPFCFFFSVICLVVLVCSAFIVWPFVNSQCDEKTTSVSSH